MRETTKIRESGYTNCACRDCFEIAIGYMDEPNLCNECDEAGCSADGDAECDAPGAYLGAMSGEDIIAAGGCPRCAPDACVGSQWCVRSEAR